MTNHPNRSRKSKLDTAIGLILADDRCGYRQADTEGRRNIRRNVTRVFNDVYGLASEAETHQHTAEQMADWYRQNEWNRY